MRYIGSELELFQYAEKWKSYFSAVLQPFIKGHVLEVGAGCGGTTNYLVNPAVVRWVCLEPDGALLAQLRMAHSNGGLPRICEVRSGVVADIDDSEKFDAILYIDVLEHIKDDAAELEKAVAHLRAGGRLVILAPAHKGLFSEFDRAIGHQRRYSMTSLAGIAPRLLTLDMLWYLDSGGFFISMANRVLLKQRQPTLGQVIFWDRYVIPLSRFLDRLLNYRFGKSVLGVWTRATN